MDGLADWHQSIIHSIHQMVDLASTKIDGYEFDIVHCLQTIWRQLYSNVSFDTAMRKDHENNERIKAILHYIHLHYSDDITLSDIANCIHLSPSECSRMFTNYMHTHLFTYLQRYRIEKSLDYLSNSNDSITEIASRVGFPDSNYYSKIFAKYKKCSPRAYRKHLAN
jgi:YesN/AraC family two-component response regulator